MTPLHRFALFVSLVSFTACTAPPMPPASTALPPDAMIDAASMSDDGPNTFTIALANDDIVGARGDRITIDVRIVRTGGFAEPVLVELVGMPDPLVSLARESRPGDAITTLSIRTDPDGEPISRSAFVVQATTFDGLRQIAPAHITVE